MQEEQTKELPRDLEIDFAGAKAFTAETTVDLLLYARHATECRLSNDGQAWSAWEAYGTRHSWELSEGDGIKQVYYQCRNREGDESVPVAATITLDSAAPLISMAEPVEGQTYTGRLNLVFTATDNISPTLKCSAKLDGNPVKIGTITAGKEQNITIPASEGEHTLELKCSDGILSAEKSVLCQVVKAPLVKLVINDGSGYTEQSNVILTVESETAAECRFSNTKDSWGGWLPYAKEVSWELSGKDGSKTVYAQCKNAKEALSDVVFDRIVFDSSPPPYISLQINNGISWTNSLNVTLSMYAYAANECRFSNDGSEWSAWEPYKRKKSWMLSGGEGEKTVYYNCRKKDSTDIGIVSAVIEYSSVPMQPPSLMSIKINGGGEYANSQLVPLDLSAIGAYQCRYKEGSLEWSEWEDYAVKRNFEMSASDGAKTIYYECRNDYGSTMTYGRIYLDRTAPGEVSGLRAQASPYAVHLFWNAAKDAGSGIKLYQIFRKNSNGSKVWAGLTSELNFKDEAVISGESYDYSIQAVDLIGNYGRESAGLTVNVPTE